MLSPLPLPSHSSPPFPSAPELIALLREYKRRFAKEYGILALGLFGSAARAATHEKSDVDIVVSLRKPDLFLLAGIKSELEDQMHRPVDVVICRNTMNPFLKQKIDQEAIYV
ncbi:MAG: nucleotidyltransferase domain-containing protein [Thermodesulfobacteriota bacterium]